jgi:hypothetical protein
VCALCILGCLVTFLLQTYAYLAKQLAKLLQEVPLEGLKVGDARRDGMLVDGCVTECRARYCSPGCVEPSLQGLQAGAAPALQYLLDRARVCARRSA